MKLARNLKQTLHKVYKVRELIESSELADELYWYIASIFNVLKFLRFREGSTRFKFKKEIRCSK